MAELLPPDDERELLDGFLDWFRGCALARVQGLDLEGATRVATPSGLTLLGIVKHLTWVEEGWFGRHLHGDDLELTDNATSFVLTPSDTVASVIAAYEVAIEESRRIAAATSLDERARIPHDLFGPVTLRWILVHLIEETAAHKGHMDILRELTDGETG